jgi:hypothetical protein
MSEKVSRELSPPITAVTSGDQQRGMDFAEAIYAIVHRLGPSRYSSAQKEAMGQYLVGCAVDWAKRHRAQEYELSSAEQVDGRGPGIPQNQGAA